MSNYYKILLGLIGAAYFISPVDLIPDLLLPYLGWLDDAMIVGLIFYYIKNGRLPNFFYKKQNAKYSDFQKKSGYNFSENSFSGKSNFSYNNAKTENKNARNDNHQSDRTTQHNYTRNEDRPGTGNTEYQNNGSHRNNDHNEREKAAKIRSPYDVLGVSAGASRDEIVAAYRKAVKEYHPDRVAHLGKDLQELANQRFIEIREAYNKLNKKA
ncbi:putative DnaJ4 [Desulfamplus magnetovallimortis]|uniref:Putative DnaJ4 n=2 Tax=Desulfamplus magnetovallimortis TaxID=1246637 RepID=A0A1W1HE32_9BACT|nr:putative DnaJ4 [Desulfamplus magnetovallimortis]